VSLTGSTSTARTLATQVSTTEALIDRKFATFRTEMESSFASQLASQLDATIERLVSPLLQKFEQLSTQMEEAHRSRVHAATLPPPSPPNHHHTTAYDPRYYTSREPDNISVHSQSPGRPLPPPPQGYHPHYQQPSPHQFDSHQRNVPPAPNLNPWNAPPAQYYHPHPPDYQHNNYVQHHLATDSSMIRPSTSFPDDNNNIDQSMTELHQTITDPNQSIINHSMTDPNITLTTDQSPNSPRSPVATQPKGILVENRRCCFIS
jgi:hypothetical protein